VRPAEDELPLFPFEMDMRLMGCSLFGVKRGTSMVGKLDKKLLRLRYPE
jgi:hypothetical protein